ncbi:hypothetical protein AXG93_468s1010 [Marchantia polymorpha subsp. ruderalis]|uniref:Uncharacterized protein n=1 Tax=Marchantia polymorpha subsp. ruderalis TaxID=1480154 RepID=A0A176VSY1_MARPO|nr:hypothetical protein AXG93_468s1010 [Marchantia polymorpha subsp. ruderalis]
MSGTGAPARTSNAFGASDSVRSAFGGTELLRQKRLRGDKRDQQKGQDKLTSVNAFGDAPTLTDVFKGTPSALRFNAFGGEGKDRVESRPEAKASTAVPSATRLRRSANRATSTDDG